MSKEDIKRFFELPDEEKEEAYNRLSNHDQLGVRMARSIPDDVFIPCNTCKYRVGISFSCEAYPGGLTKQIVEGKIKNPKGPCANGYKFKASE